MRPAVARPAPGMRPASARRTALARALLFAALVATLPAAALAKSDGQNPGDKDWIDSPFTGNGVTPNETTKVREGGLESSFLVDGKKGRMETTIFVSSHLTTTTHHHHPPYQVYVSAYLDRLLEVHQDDYYFKAKFYFYLTWTDDRAYENMQEATADAKANNGTCDKLCNGQRPFGVNQNCCTGVWLPSLLSRNVMMYPQDRVQPYVIDVKPDGTVTWRVEVTGLWYTFLQLRAFPFDRQRLTVSLAYTNFNPKKSVVDLVPSASGTNIFTLGDGDTLSGWDVVDVWVEANLNKTFQSQFVQFKRDASNADDPAPISPPPGSNATAYGTGVSISSVVSGVCGCVWVHRMCFFGNRGMFFNHPLFLSSIRPSSSASSASPSTTSSPSSCPSFS